MSASHSASSRRAGGPPAEPPVAYTLQRRVDGGDLAAIVFVEAFEHAGQGALLAPFQPFRLGVALQPVEIVLEPRDLAEQVPPALEHRLLERGEMRLGRHGTSHHITFLRAAPGPVARPVLRRYLAWIDSR